MYGDWYARTCTTKGTTNTGTTGACTDTRQRWDGRTSSRLEGRNFDPEGLMDLFTAAGGKYFVAQGMHHDNFDNSTRAHNRFNSVNVGPKKDICGLWKKAGTRAGCPLGLRSILGASFNWWAITRAQTRQAPTPRSV